MCWAVSFTIHRKTETGDNKRRNFLKESSVMENLKFKCDFDVPVRGDN